MVTELMLPAKGCSRKIGLIELREPVLALLAGSSSRRHTGDNTSIDALGEIIKIGPLGPLPRGCWDLKKKKPPLSGCSREAKKFDLREASE